MQELFDKIARYPIPWELGCYYHDDYLIVEDYRDGYAQYIVSNDTDADRLAEKLGV